MAATAGDIPTESLWRSLALLWLAGMGLRVTLLAVPPVITLIHADLHLSETEIGILGTLPSLMLGFAALPGSLLIARYGARMAVVIGLVVVALGSAARAAASDVALLYLTTIAMSAGVALMQPAMPPLVRDWLPRRIALATAVYTNGLVVSETLAVALTIPFVLPLAGGSWRLSFVFWGVPVLLIALAILLWAPQRPSHASTATAAARRWWPDWRDPLVLRLALVMACINTDYFAVNTFLPDYLHALGRSDLIAAALTSLNVMQLPASFLMLAIGSRVTLRHATYVVVGLLNLISILGMMLMPGIWIVIWAGLLGFSNAIGLILLLALPPLLTPAENVHRLSAAMFTLSYPCAVAMSVLAGVVWDATAQPWIAFVPMAVCAVGLAILPLRLRLERVA